MDPFEKYYFFDGWVSLKKVKTTPDSEIFFLNNSISQKGSLNRHGGMSVGPGDRAP